MKLNELAAPDSAQKYADLFESYFGQNLPLATMNQRQTRVMLTRVSALLEEYRQSHGNHASEHDDRYLKALMLEKALSARVLEQVQANTTTASDTAAQREQARQAQQTQQKVQRMIASTRDPQTRNTLQKASRRQPLSPSEQAILSSMVIPQVNQPATMESRARRRNMLRESEVQQAQVVLAAQDMVDSMQGMLEDTTEMQFKELPALVDSIRNQIGMEQANQFNTDATAALTGLVQNLQGAKQQLEQALAVVTGQAQATPALDAAMSGGAAAAPAAPAPDLGDEEDLDLSLDANLPAEEPEEPAGTAGALGRARR